MIHFINVGKWYVIDRDQTAVILQPTTLSVPTDRRVGLLGAPKSGLSTVVNMIAGRTPPTIGQIVREGVISPPVGYMGAVNVKLTAAENAAFFARIYEADPLEVIDSVLAFADLGEYEDLPTGKYPMGLRARVAYALSYALRFECFLVDDAIGPRRRDAHERCRLMLKDVYRDSGLFLATHDPDMLREYCDLALVLKNQTLIPFTNVEEAILYHDED